MKKLPYILIGIGIAAAIVWLVVLPQLRRAAYVSGYQEAKDKTPRERANVILPGWFTDWYIRGHHDQCNNCPPTPPPTPLPTPTPTP